VTFLLMLGTTLAWREARHGRWEQAGLWLGVLSSVKPFLAIFWLYLAMVHRRAAVSMTVAAIVPFLLGLATFGLTAYVSWIVAVSSVSWTWATMNGSIAGIISRALARSPLFTPVVSRPDLVAPLILAGCVAVSVASFRALRRADRQAPRVTGDPAADRAFAVLLLTAQLITPLGWVYYLWLACGPLLAIGLSQSRWSPPRRVFAVAGILGLGCPLLVTGIWSGTGWATVTIGSVYFWTTLSMWLFTVDGGPHWPGGHGSYARAEAGGPAS
jgi:hypothetical protein